MRLLLKAFLIAGLMCGVAGCGGVRVRKGDTLYSISKNYDIPMRALIEENGLEPPYTLTIGQYLYFPKIKTHRVRRGDTLYSIATQHNMSVSSLAKMNNIVAPYTIYQGQVLRISSWGGDQEKPIYSEKDRAPSLNKGKAANLNADKSSGSVAQDKKAEIERRKGVKNPAAFRGKANVPKSQAKKKFSWPTSGKIGTAFGSGNDGINILGKAGTSIKAADSGTVAYAGNELKGYGNLVLIRHKDGWITAYAHNRKLLVKKGDIVKKGQKIAEMGKTGNVKSPQLHFEIRYKAKVVNPTQYLP